MYLTELAGFVAEHSSTLIKANNIVYSSTLVVACSHQPGEKDHRTQKTTARSRVDRKAPTPAGTATNTTQAPHMHAFINCNCSQPPPVILYYLYQNQEQQEQNISRAPYWPAGNHVRVSRARLPVKARVYSCIQPDNRPRPERHCYVRACSLARGWVVSAMEVRHSSTADAETCSTYWCSASKLADEEGQS